MTRLYNGKTGVIYQDPSFKSVHVFFVTPARGQRINRRLVLSLKPTTCFNSECIKPGLIFRYPNTYYSLFRIPNPAFLRYLV